MNSSITAGLLYEVFSWRNADYPLYTRNKETEVYTPVESGCITHTGRRFATELALVVAVPVALIELTVRAVFQALSIAITTAALPLAYIFDFKIKFLSHDGLFNTGRLLYQLPFQLITQPFSERSRLY